MFGLRIRPTLLLCTLLGSGWVRTDAAVPMSYVVPVLSPLRSPAVLPIVPGPRLTVRVPKGAIQLVLEQRQGSGWKPVKVEHLTFAANERVKVVPVILPPGIALSKVRAVAYATVKFPSGFAAGQRDFERVVAQDGMTLVGGGLIANLFLPSSAAAYSSVDPSPSPVTDPNPDIWRVVGNRLLFFNQSRGLQVFDLGTPAAPKRLGTLGLPAAGEAMHLLNDDGTACVLVGAPQRIGYDASTSLFLVRLTDGVPRLVRELRIEEEVIASRRLGTRLFLLTRKNRGMDASPQWELALHTVDLSKPDVLEMTPRVDLGFSWGGHLEVSEGRLLISTQVSLLRAIHLVDSGADGGPPKVVKTFLANATVFNKSTMGILNGALVVVSHIWEHSRMGVWLETFPIAGSATAPLARIELPSVGDSSSYSMRFAGDRAFIVPLHPDVPLLAVDLANPAQPVVLQAPAPAESGGTAMELGADRLVTIGGKDGRVVVSLFDPADAGVPRLLSRILLGQAGATNSTEAWADDKAASFFPAEGLMALPMRSYSSATGYVHSMQLIEIGRDALSVGTAVQLEAPARRAAVIGNHVVVISGQEMKVIDRALPDAAPVAKLSLAWRVDRVLPFGRHHLLQLTDGTTNELAERPALIRITAAADPDAVVEEIVLGTGRIIGTVQKANRLFVAEWAVPHATGPAVMRTWIFDLSTPPRIRLLKAVAQSVAHSSGRGVMPDAVHGIWPQADTLVWHVPAQNTAGASAAPAVTAALLCPVVRAMSTAAAAGPVLRVGSNVPVSNVSRAICENGLLYFSFDEWWPYNGLGIPESSYSVVRSRLQVVDFKATPPIVRTPASIPGKLLSVSHADAQGALVFTQLYGEGEGVHVSGYDGLTSYLIDKVSSEPTYYAGAAVGDRLYFASGSNNGVVGFGYDAVVGRFTSLGIRNPALMPTLLRVLENRLLGSTNGHWFGIELGSDGRLGPLTEFDLPGSVQLRVDRAVPFSTGTAGSPPGLLFPASDYGVEFVPSSVFE